MRARWLPLLNLALILGTASAVGAQVGPDVIVSDTFAPLIYGAVGDVSGYSVSTTSCNIGDLEAIWILDEPLHPLIGLQLYRLHEGRFEQIGMSWLKHAFCAVNEQSCGACQDTPCDTLGIGCADTYSTVNNGDQTRLGPRSEVNAASGDYLYPFGAQNQTGDVIYKRLQAHNDDLDPALNPGALYFLEIQYLTTDEQAWGTQYNNSSYRPIFVGDFENGGWDLNYSVDEPLVLQQSAIHGWQANDAEVGLEEVLIDDDGQMIVGHRVTDLGGGQFRYQYTITNVNSDRSAGGFSVPIPAGVTVSNIGFHDVDYHSGEPYAATDWTDNLAGGFLTWSTEAFADNEDANALRWSTSYTFWFDADSLPAIDELTIDLFKPGTPTSATVMASAPGVPGVFIRGDCNRDLSVQLGDALLLLGVMFTPGTPPPSCLKSCDFNDSGNLELVDAIGLLTYLFLSGPDPAPPFPDPGTDDTPDPLPCI